MYCEWMDSIGDRCRMQSVQSAECSSKDDVMGGMKTDVRGGGG